MPGRNWAAGSYRFGFQGQEMDNEVKGTGNSISYKYRVHDPRIGKFLSIDPLTPKYPFYSPYAFSGNRVIDAVELEGLEPWLLSDGSEIYGPFNHDYIDENGLIPTYNLNPVEISPNNASTTAENSGENNNRDWSGSLWTTSGEGRHGVIEDAPISLEDDLLSLTVEGRFIGASYYNDTGEGYLDLALSLGAEEVVLKLGLIFVLDLKLLG